MGDGGAWHPGPIPPTARSRAAGGTGAALALGIMHLPGDRDLAQWDLAQWDPWLPVGAEQGCGDLETSSVEVSLGQGLTAQGGCNGVLSCGQGGGSC